MMLRRIVSVGLVSLIGSGTALIAAPAEASTGRALGQHCRMSVETGESACFLSIPQLLASFGIDRPQAVAVGQAEVDAIRATDNTGLAATYVLSVVYDKDNWDIADGSYTFYASSGCDNDGAVEWQIGNAGSTWNDRITSYPGVQQV